MTNRRSRRTNFGQRGTVFIRAAGGPDQYLVADLGSMRWLPDRPGVSYRNAHTAVCTEVSTGYVSVSDLLVERSALGLDGNPRARILLTTAVTMDRFSHQPAHRENNACPLVPLTEVL
jgi:hypothetical protein